MKKPFFRESLATVLIGCIILAFIGNLSVVYGVTEVTGVIGSDTTWTLANSPYNITGPVLVSSDVTLTIEPGVTVNFIDYDYYMQVDGTLVAKGTSINPIYFNGGSSIRFSEEIKSWDEQTATGSIIENAILRYVGIQTYGAPKITNNDIFSYVRVRGGTPIIANNYIDGRISVAGGSPSIVNNTIWGNAGSDSYGRPVYDEYGINLDGGSEVYIADNLIYGDFTEASILVDEGAPIIERNMISNRYGLTSDSDRRQSGIRVSRNASPLIQNNSITRSSRGITCYSSSATIIYNNIHSNTNYNIYLEHYATNDFNAPNNWWGTTNATTINGSIRDFKNDFNLGRVNFTPFLTEPNSEAIAIPTTLDVVVSTSSVDVGSGVSIVCPLFDIRGISVGKKSVDLFYSVDGNDWILIETKTSTDGVYRIQWLNPDTGVFKLKAEWKGDSEFSAATATANLTLLDYQNQSRFLVLSNSTVSALTFDSTNAGLSFTVSGDSGTTGYVRATIPKDLLSSEGDWTVLVDGQPIDSDVYAEENCTRLIFYYGHSTKNIQIIGTTAIPEFPSWFVLPMLLVVSFVMVVVRKGLGKGTVC